jgi:hypothetical protein
MKASDIAAKIEQVMPAAFANFGTTRSGATRTRTALTTIGELGHELGFEVSCNQNCYSKRDYREWVYDQMWYANHSTKKGFMIRAPMVLEAEFSRPDSGIDDDFPKLVMARADVRVWLSWSVAARNHIGLFKDQIRELYSLPGDEWVFGIYDWRLRTPVIERYTVSQEDLIRAAA